MGIPLALLLALSAQSGQRAIEVELTPASDPQMAIWLEDDQARYVDTIMVTRLVGTFGLGNRPGRLDFGGGYLWPYGRRENALPVWAHRRGVLYDRIVFQDCRESALGWHESHSSLEPFYCRPVTQAEMSVDTITCPTTRFSSDKGIPVRLLDKNRNPECANFSEPSTSPYPPRNDVVTRDNSRDWEGVEQFQSMNELDAVSRATPAATLPYRVSYQLPGALAAGTYTVWVEVNQDFDPNAFHDYEYFVDPALRDYGMSHAGQPSLIWKVPITVGEDASGAQLVDYVGYGSPTGEDGNVRPPDQTISTDTPASGTNRVITQSNEVGPFKVRVAYSPDAPCSPPEPVDLMTVTAMDWNLAELSFQPSALPDVVSLYEIRYQEGSGSIPDAAAFMNAVPGPEIPAASEQTSFSIERLQAATTYTVAIRAHNFCQQTSAIHSIEIQTTERDYQTVDACFIATAAHGSLFHDDVQSLRDFRDRHLNTSSLGQTFVAGYYAVSPPVARFIARHDALRAVTRFALRPLSWLASHAE